MHTKIYYLIGMMGTGKSVIGLGASRILNLPFLDMDEYITGTEQKTINEIFSTYGEDYFRDLEKNYLQNLNFEEAPVAIVSTGGGAPAFLDNMDFMNRHGRTIWIDSPLPVIFERLKNMKTDRPLIKQLEGSVLEEKLNLIYESRAPIYGTAHFTIENTGYSHEAIDQLVQLITVDLKN